MRTTEFSDQFYNKQNCGGQPRRATDITCIVLHSTEGPTALGGAQTLTTRPDATVEIVVDDDHTYRICPELKIPCGVKDVNTWTLHIEQAGYAHWSKKAWLRRVKTIQRAAFWTAYWQTKYDIPNKFLTTQDIDSGARRGWTTHNNLSLSQVSSSTHSDPGPHWPRSRFLAYVGFYKLSMKLFRTRPREA